MGYALLVTDNQGDEVCRWLLCSFYRQLHIAEESCERMQEHYNKTASTQNYVVTIVKLGEVEK